MQTEVSNAPKFAAATPGPEMYSQIGSRGEPWTAVRSFSTRRSGSAARYSREAGLTTSVVHRMAAAAASLNQAVSTSPTAAPSWLPITARALRSRSREMTSLGCGP